METAIVGAGLRVIEAAAFAAPTLLCGLLVAGVFRRLLGTDGVYRLFGGSSPVGLARAWALGMLLPVCSFGAIPVAREMLRAGLPGGTVLAFALAAPLFNPLSVLYGLTLSHPSVILWFTFCSLVLVTGVGMAWGWIFPSVLTPASAPPAIAYGWRRMAAALAHVCTEWAGPTLAYFLIGLAAIGAMGFLLPHGYLQRTMQHDDWTSPLLMALVAFPAYATPTMVMGQLGLMFDHGNSVGAALVLLTLGAGVNVGTLVWVGRNFGLKATVGWLVLFLGLVLALAYIVDKPLYHAVDVADHTHAFDIYTSPFPGEVIDPMLTASRKLAEEVGRHEWYSLASLGVLLLIGLGLRLLERYVPLEQLLTAPPDAPQKAAVDAFDFIVPNWALAAVALFGLVLLSIGGCYIYYPEPNETLEDIRLVRTNTLADAMALNDEYIDRNVELWMDLTRRLEIGVMIRGMRLTPEMLSATAAVRKSLDLLRHAVDDRDGPHAKELIKQINEEHAVCIRLFRAGQPD